MSFMSVACAVYGSPQPISVEKSVICVDVSAVASMLDIKECVSMSLF